MNCIYPSPLLRYLGEGRIRLVLPANYAIKECRKTPPPSIQVMWSIQTNGKPREKFF